MLKCYNFAMDHRISIVVMLGTGLYLAPPTFADYTIVLKNGRRVTVQNYREEGAAIKVPALGGELGIPKEQIQAILKADQTTGQGLNVSDLTSTKRETQSEQKPTSPSSPDSKNGAARVDETAAANAEEVEQYRQRLADVTQKLELARQQYYKATQGGGTGTNASNEGLKAWAMDLASRIHDSQKAPGGGGAKSTPPSPPYAPNYTAKEKEFSNLRTQVDALQSERDKLINEMNSRNIPTGLR